MAGAGVAGEAVVVDLGQRGLLFALMDSEPHNEFFATFNPNPAKQFGCPGNYSADASRYYKTLKGKPMKLGVRSRAGSDGYVPEYSKRPTDLPDFVTFTDASKPETGQPVDPENLESSFGKDVKLQSVMLEITDESLTRHIHNVLPWINDPDQQGLQKKGEEMQYMLPNDDPKAKRANFLFLTYTDRFKKGETR